MIQRIQTIYLFLSLILVVLCFILPIAELSTSAGQIEDYTLKGLSAGNAGRGFSQIIMVISGIVIALTFLNIFQFKKRKRQMIICIIIMVVLIIIPVLTYYQLGQLRDELGMTIVYKLPFVFPLISAVLNYLAYRGIKKDDELVKSYDRLR